SSRWSSWSSPRCSSCCCTPRRTRCSRSLGNEHPSVRERRVRVLARMVVPALFGAAAIFTSERAAGAIAHALDHATTRAWLLAGYGILRAGVAVAFAVFTVGRSEPRRRARQPLAFAACAAAMATVLLFR